MTVGTSSQDAADEHARREKMREEYDAGLDRVPTSRQERYERSIGREPDDQDISGAGFGAAGIMGDLS